MSCPSGYLLTAHGCEPMFRSLGAAGDPCVLPDGRFGRLNEINACGFYGGLTFSPCTVNGQFGVIDGEGFCVLLTSGQSQATNTQGGPCTTTPCIQGLVALTNPINGACQCWCPDGSPPVPGTDGPNFTLAQKCPSTVGPNPVGCPPGQIQDENGLCVCPWCPAVPPCPEVDCPVADCPACPGPDCSACPKTACPPPTDVKAGIAESPSLWPWLLGGLAAGLGAGYLLGQNGKKKKP